MTKAINESRLWTEAAIALAPATLMLLLGGCSDPGTVPPAGSRVASEPKSGEYIEKSLGSLSMRCMQGDDQAASIGSFVVTILNNGQPVTAVTGARDGTIQDCWITNIDADENAEVFLFTRSAGSGGYAELHVYELAGNELYPAKIPEPDAELMEGYQGRDSYDAREGRLFRTFPVYLDGDSNCCPGGGDRVIEFDSANDKWELSAVQPLAPAQ